MIADWSGAGLAITGKMNVKDWYDKNKDNILLNISTRKRVENILDDELFKK